MGGPGGLPDEPEIEIDSTDTCKTSKEELLAIFPNASEDTRSKVADAINAHGKKFGIDTKEKVAHFLGQAGEESGGLTDFTENLSYSATRLVEVWPSRFSQTDTTKADPDDYANDSEKLANFVYANRNNNGDEDSGDGYKYRGRGIFQLTFKSNYQNFTNYYQDEFNSTNNFVTNPELVGSNVEIATISAMWFYQNKVQGEVDIFDESDDSAKAITKAVRGVETSWEDRQDVYDDAVLEIDCIQ